MECMEKGGEQKGRKKENKRKGKHFALYKKMVFLLDLFHFRLQATTIRTSIEY